MLVSGVVDRFEVGFEEVFIEVVGGSASLVYLEVKDCAGDLEKVLRDVFLFSLELLKLGLDQNVLLRFFNESVELSGFILSEVSVEKVEFGEDINKINLSYHVLTEKKDILIFLMKLPHQMSVRSSITGHR